MIDLATKLRRNEEQYTVNNLGEEAVMMNVTNGDFIGLNTVGTEIWHLLQEPISFEALVKKLMDIYEVAEKQCIDETLPYINKMIGEKMIKIVEN
ncbi:PqqD family peptide modification chaperone [Emticicia sp. BO119]|uniref:PqqD family peptide modification chaperone n=1 Tax=Emticicia sp. BO119 TaxID=2757768 RepID=UPI0015F02811|nr:PqqD family peptide modification chaperone [Emticicia sp. BO119]MBA4848792.1 PqqD family protein [Emticicia sp. BO119]